MRILLVHVRYRAAGGEDVVVEAEAELLRSAGHEVAIHELENPQGGRQTLAALARAPWNTRGARAVVEATALFDPDVVHVHNTWFALSPAIFRALREQARPVVMTLHNYRLLCVDGTLWRDGAICRDCVGRTPLAGVVHGCYRDSRALSAIAAATIETARRRHAWDDVSTFVAPTETVRSVHIDAGLPPDRVVVKPHFMTDFGGRTTPPSQARTLVFVGRLVASKGIERLIDAWRLAEADLGDTELLVVGDGPLREQLERDAPPRVRFAGARPLAETREQIRSARAFVFPSQWLEPFGLVLLEAMVAGTPIVGTDTGSTGDLVGDAGRLVPVGSTDALAGALRATADDTLVDTLGAAARRRYEARYTPAANLALLEAIYRDAIDRNR